MQTEHPGTIIADWLAAEGRKPAWLAREADLSQSHLSLVLAQKKRLSPESADRVSRITSIDARRLLGISIPDAAA